MYPWSQNECRSLWYQAYSINKYPTNVLRKVWRHVRSLATKDTEPLLCCFIYRKGLYYLNLADSRRPPGCPRTTWMKTTQKDLESFEPLPERSNWRGSESSTLENDVYVWGYAYLVVHARNEWINEWFSWRNRIDVVYCSKKMYCHITIGEPLAALVSCTMWDGTCWSAVRQSWRMRASDGQTRYLQAWTSNEYFHWAKQTIPASLPVTATSAAVQLLILSAYSPLRQRTYDVLSFTLTRAQSNMDNMYTLSKCGIKDIVWQSFSTTVIAFFIFSLSLSLSPEHVM